MSGEGAAMQTGTDKMIGRKAFREKRKPAFQGR